MTPPPRKGSDPAPPAPPAPPSPPEPAESITIDSTAWLRLFDRVYTAHHRRLRPAALLALYALRPILGQRIPLDDLADRLDLSAATARKHLEALARLGVITITREPGHRGGWTITLSQVPGGGGGPTLTISL